MTSQLSRSLSTGLVCLAVVALAACGRDDPAKLVASAKAYLAKQDYTASAIQLKNALQKQPTNAEARYLLGVALNEMGDPVSAEKEFRRALEYKHPPVVVLPELAKTMVRIGDAKKLVDEFGTTRLDDPAAEATLKTELGTAYLALEQIPAARGAYAAALAARPGDAKARVGEARIAAIERNPSGAMKIVDEVLAQSSAQPDALALKADLLLAQNQVEPAKQTLVQLLQVQPDNGSARFALATVLIEEKRFEQARAEIDAMKKRLPQDWRSRYLDASLAYRQGDAAKAREAILEVLRVAPDNTQALLLAGAIELQNRAFVTAETHIRKALLRAPQNVVARRLLAATYLGMGQAAKAEEILAPSLKVAPDDPLLLRLAGEIALANGNLTKASQQYAQAAARDKDNAALRTRLGQVRFATGDPDQGVKDLEAASTIDPSQYQADLTLILAHTQKREYDKALAAAGTLEKKQPDNPLTFYVKGTIFLMKGDQKAARANLGKSLELRYDYLPAAATLARMDVADKKPEVARSRFESILAKDPKNEQALLALAEVMGVTQAPMRDVVAMVDRAVAANPTSVPARLAAVSVRTQSGDAKGALAAAQAASAALPGNQQILATLGQTQLAAGEPRQAIETFNKLAATLPQSPGPLLLAARAQVAAKDFDAATQSVRNALALQPGRVDVHRDAIAVLLAAGKPDEALADARALQKARPDEAVGYVLEGEALVAQKKLNEAAKAYTEALKHRPTAPVVLRLHALLVAAGKAAEGDAVAARWLKENPKDTTLRLYLAERDLQRKEYGAAARVYRDVLALQPDNPIVLNNLAWALSQLKDRSAVDYAEKAHALAPQSPTIADTLGWILFERGETKRGTELLAQAAAGAPDSTEIRLHYAKALIKSGDKPGARKELEEVQSRPDPNPFRAEAEALLKQL